MKEIPVPVDPSGILKKSAEANGWTFGQEAEKLYRRAEIIMDRFYHGIRIPGNEGRLPTPLMAIDTLNIKTLAAYHVIPDEYGLRYKITFNERHYENDGEVAWRFGEWALTETLTHELGHHWQQLKGKDPYKPGKRVTHNKEFTAKLEQLGIYSTLGHGAHYKPADPDKPFGWLMQEWGIQRPSVPVEFQPAPKVDWFRFSGTEARGRSTLTKWYCSVCSFAIRVGVKGDIQVTHDPCDARFVRALK